MIDGMKRKKPIPKTRKKSGPKSGCTDAVCDLAYQLSLLGLTNVQMASVLGVSPESIKYWFRNNEMFKQAVQRGRELASAKVADALFQRAIGYEHEAVQFFKIPEEIEEYDEDGNVIRVKKTSKVIPIPFTKRYPPDTRAAIKILGVRNRETWGETYKVEHKHSHMHVQGMNIHQVLDGAKSVDDFSDKDLEMLAKFGVLQAAADSEQAPN